MRVRIHRDKCFASGSCAFTSPAVFSQDDEGLVLLLQPYPHSTLRAEVQEAAAHCPGQAIDIDD